MQRGSDLRSAIPAWSLSQGLFVSFNRLKHLICRAIIMHVREYTRYTAGKDIMVILTLPVSGIYPLIGPLVDLSRSGLCFTYLPLQHDMDILVQGLCEVVYKYGFRSFSQPIPSRIVYETAFLTSSSFMVPARRCGVQFLTPLSVLDIESICG